MIRLDDAPAIYLVCGVTDLRKGIDAYAHIIQDRFRLDPFKDALFHFYNRNRDKLKCLYWDGTGFWLSYKRLEKGHFKGYIKMDGISSVFCFIWGWEEPAWGLPFQFHGVFYVMISMKGP